MSGEEQAVQEEEQVDVGLIKIQVHTKKGVFFEDVEDEDGIFEERIEDIIHGGLRITDGKHQLQIPPSGITHIAWPIREEIEVATPDV